MISLNELVLKVQSYLTDDLRRPQYRGNKNKLAGHCYVASEVLATVLGKEWKPCFIRHEGSPHWFLRHRKTGEVLDATSSQFSTRVPYEHGKGKGFLTKKPSARAQIILIPLLESLILDHV